MALTLDVRHWLTASGEPVPRLRRQVLRIARLIEYGGPLDVGQLRTTLVECSRRPGRKPCLGLLEVVKFSAGHIDAICPVCEEERIYVSGWEGTAWAKGPAAPVDVGAVQVGD